MENAQSRKLTNRGVKVTQKDGVQTKRRGVESKCHRGLMAGDGNRQSTAVVFSVEFGPFGNVVMHHCDLWFRVSTGAVWKKKPSVLETLGASPFCTMTNPHVFLAMRETTSVANQKRLLRKCNTFHSGMNKR